ncbi:hypothetical protein [Shewanella glacialipiscicola]|uniref:hypothetical protein n=1 Tax=Shewanella glacialipiscicola TaxID=614069 RepID=UPI003D7C12AA
MKSNVLKFPSSDSTLSDTDTNNVKSPSVLSSERMIRTRKGEQFLCYTDWVEYMRALGITNRASWLKYIKQPNRPEFIPASPPLFYGNRKQWKGWGELDPFAKVVKQSSALDIKSRGGVWASYETASNFAQNAGIKTMAEWVAYLENNEKPRNIPTDPRSFYSRKKMWQSWNHFLGTPEPYDYKQKGGLDKVKLWFLENNITTSTQFFELANSKQLPDFVPSSPTLMYNLKFKDFLVKHNKYMTFAKARRTVKSWGCANMLEFRAKHRDLKANGDSDAAQIPSAPERVYKDKWEGWSNFLRK